MTDYRPSGFSILPPVVKNLIIINGLMFLATIAISSVDLIDLLGLHYFSSEKFKSYQLITYMFMHGGIAHIFFNMFAVWMFGSAIENLWGGQRFLAYYITTGFGAAFTHYAVVHFQIQSVISDINVYLANPESFEDLWSVLPQFAFSDEIRQLIDNYNAAVSIGNMQEASQYSLDLLGYYKIEYLNSHNVVGASGSLFGILLAFGMMYPNQHIYLMFFPFPIKAKWFVMGYGAIELISGLKNDPGDNVAHFAHLGGMLFGFILIKLWQKR